MCGVIHLCVSRDLLLDGLLVTNYFLKHILLLSITLQFHLRQQNRYGFYQEYMIEERVYHTAIHCIKNEPVSREAILLIMLIVDDKHVNYDSHKVYCRTLVMIEYSNWI